MNGCYVAGADPELMLATPEGTLTSAVPLVPGTKEKPKKVKGGAVQHDNVMAEFNVTPSGTSEEFEDSMRQVLKSLAKMVAPHRLVVQASAEFPETALDTDEARVFGCDPDFDSWTLAMNQIDSTRALERFRTAGGHFHIGAKDAIREMMENPYGKVEVVKMLDVFQGIPSILLDEDPTAVPRRELYGKAGAHRPKDYGVEYRALGNFWVRSPRLVHLMYELADLAVKLTHEGQSQEIIETIGESRIQRIINKSDRRGAKSVVAKVLSKYLPKHLLDQLNPVGEDFYTAWGI